MAFDKLPLHLEVKIVALIARGDTYKSIQSQIKRDLDRDISAGVITAIKKRNSQALESIQQAIIQKEQDDAEGLLQRSHRLLGKKLRGAETDMAKYDEYKQQYLNGEIDEDEFKTQTKLLELPAINVLTTVSREMFAQTKAAQGDPNKSDAIGDPREKLKQLQNLLEENDEIRLERIIFAKRDQSTQTLPGSGENQPARWPEDGVSLPREDTPAGDNPNGQTVQDPSQA